MDNSLLGKLRTHIAHNSNGRVVSDLYQNRLGDYVLHINFEDIEGVHFAHIEIVENAVSVWEDIVK